MKIVMAKMAVDRLAALDSPPPNPPAACIEIGWGKPSAKKTSTDNAQSVAKACVQKLAKRAHTTGGLIILDRNGNPAAVFNTSRMAYGFVNPDDSFTIAP